MTLRPPFRSLPTLVALVVGWIVATPALADVDFTNRTGSGPLKASHSGLCLTVPNGSTANGTQLDQEPCNGSAAQTWQVKAFNNGFTLVNQASGQCIDSQISNTAGGAVIQWTCNSSAQQTWSAKAQGSGYGLVTAYSGQCLDIFGGGTASGTKAIQWGCSGAANQTFVPVAVSSGSTTSGIDFPNRTGSGPIKASHSGLCLTVPNGSTANGTQLDQEACTGSAAQTWQVKAFNNGFTLVNQANGLCIDSQMSNTAGGAVLQWTCNSSTQQTWSAKAQGAGYALVTAFSGQCLDVFGGDTASGAKLIQWGCHGGTNQTFIGGTATAGSGTGSGSGGTSGGATSGAGSGAGSGSGSTAGGSLPPGDAPPAATGLIVARHSAMCVENPGALMTTGVGIDQWPCEPNATHMDWSFVPAGSGYQIRNAKSGLCLTVTGGATNNGAATSQQTCGAGTGGLWTFRKTNGFYEIVAAHSGRCLNVYNGSRDPNAAVIQYDCTLQDNAVFSLVPPAPPSAWTPLTTIGIVPVSATVMPSGKVMMWAAESKTSFGSGNGTWITTFDPASNTSNDTYVANTNHDMFCPGTNLLPDGRLMITGGITAGGTSIYNPDTNQWTSGPTLKIPRGYNSNVTLSTGETMTYGGSWSGNIGGKSAEVWSASTGTWRVLSNVSGDAGAEPNVDMYRADNHFWMFGVSNGYVFHAGPSHEMHWIGTGGNGSFASAGNRADDTFSINGTATMFDVNRIFKAGGASQYQNQPANGATYTIDISGGPGSTPKVASAPSLAFARAFHNSVVLPNGDVILVGGQNVPIPFTDSTPVYYPELWSPSKNTVVRLAPISVPRTYHSVALLLTDGRVLSAGGGLCNCAADHPNLQILTPPYLYDANGQLASRPTITSAPTTASLGSTITASTDRAIQSFSLVRVGSTTHTVDNDQRRVPLTISGASGTKYNLALPSDPGIVTPGNWMLFALDGNGVPSVAKVVRIR
ncbi:RICIN domain-containing protein [Methylobacterium sp. NFXW15]|uniref:RICIN domain-containing protein n=1 Tax=Methylobacterium sp. NFXW15 TaxID=2819512 RepID=UPI003CE795E8